MTEALLLALLTAVAPAARAAPGDLDTTFAGDGTTGTAIGSGSDLSNFFGVAIQADGKIVVSGSSSNGSNTDFALVRYNPNGTLDTSFDTDGKATTAVGATDDIGFAVAIQADGKIVVGGSSSNGSDYDFAVVRYMPDGTLDTSFDTDGKVTTPIGSPTISATASPSRRTARSSSRGLVQRQQLRLRRGALQARRQPRHDLRRRRQGDHRHRRQQRYRLTASPSRRTARSWSAGSSTIGSDNDSPWCATYPTAASTPASTATAR